MSSLPSPRGPVTEDLFAALRKPPHRLPELTGPVEYEDLQLALYCCYELHYRGFEGVDERWEWEPSLLAARAVLERQYEDDVLELVGPPKAPPEPTEVDAHLRELMLADDAPSVSTFIEREADADQVLEFMIHRSAYQLKEADPHTWALPRLWGKPKGAMVEVQSDEYGNGRPDDIHAELFARAMNAVGLDSTYGAYLDQIPGVTLATVNLMSLFGLHRRLRGAIVGHLALFEMTSSVPNRRYAAGLRRLGYGDDACLFFDVHVVADAVHESVAAVDLAGGLAQQDPKLGADVLWGATALLAVDGRWARHMMDAWGDGASSLRPELALR
jgi:hypothetical protein